MINEVLEFAYTAAKSTLALMLYMFAFEACPILVAVATAAFLLLRGEKKETPIFVRSEHHAY